MAVFRSYSFVSSAGTCKSVSAGTCRYARTTQSRARLRYDPWGLTTPIPRKINEEKYATTVWHEIFAEFNFCDFFHNPQKKKFPQKFIPRKKKFRKNLLLYWNYQDHYLMQKCVCVYLFKTSLSFKNKRIINEIQKCWFCNRATHFQRFRVHFSHLYFGLVRWTISYYCDRLTMN